MAHGAETVKTKEIVFDASSALLHRGTGIGTYTRSLAAALKEKYDGEVELLLPLAPREEDLFCEGESEDRSQRLGRFLKENKACLCHIPQNGLGLPAEKVCLETVTVHDLIPYIYPETVGRSYLREFLGAMPTVLDRADGVITVSQAAKGDILRFFDYPEEKIAVIPEAAASRFRPLPGAETAAFLRERCGLEPGFLLYVGGFGPRKNVKGLLCAVSLLKRRGLLKKKLIVAGRLKREGDELETVRDALGLSDDVIFVGAVPDRELPYFYNGASLFIYASFCEGFGLPPLEAMACGTAVVTAKTSSLPEVVGDAALLCDAFDSGDIAEKIAAVLKNDALRRDLELRAVKRAACFSWERTAAATFAFWQKLMAGKSVSVTSS